MPTLNVEVTNCASSLFTLLADTISGLLVLAASACLTASFELHEVNEIAEIKTAQHVAEKFDFMVGWFIWF